MSDRITPIPQRQAEEEEEELIQTKVLNGTTDLALQRQPEEEEEELLQTKQAAGHTSEVTPLLASEIKTMQGGGQPLPASELSFFAARFGRDFGNVRIHADAQAAESAEAVNAQAFTTGQHVVFGPDKYAPGTTLGRKLMAHELTHVVQQHPSSLQQVMTTAPGCQVMRQEAGVDLDTDSDENEPADRDTDLDIFAELFTMNEVQSLAPDEEQYLQGILERNIFDSSAIGTASLVSKDVGTYIQLAGTWVVNESYGMIPEEGFKPEENTNAFLKFRKTGESGIYYPGEMIFLPEARLLVGIVAIEPRRMRVMHADGRMEVIAFDTEEALAGDVSAAAQPADAPPEITVDNPPGHCGKVSYTTDCNRVTCVPADSSEPSKVYTWDDTIEEYTRAGETGSTWTAGQLERVVGIVLKEYEDGAWQGTHCGDQPQWVKGR